MKEKDRLPDIIATIATIIFIVFAFVISRSIGTSNGASELQGGDIQHAIDTKQY
jgi:hypothetical protein